MDRDPQEPAETIASYRDLRVWRQAISWVEGVYRASSRWPASERFGLISQVRRAAVSVPSNIAEGAARRTTGEFLQFLGVAQGSLAEAETQLIIAVRLGFSSEDDVADLLSGASDIGRMINGLKASLKRRR